MNKLIRIFSIMLIATLLIVVLSSTCMASSTTFTNALNALDDQLNSANTDVNMTDMQTTAGRVVKAVRNIAAVIAVVILSILGIKYMLGSTEERAEYKKSFIPLIVGIVVVVAAASIATAIFSIAG